MQRQGEDTKEHVNEGNWEYSGMKQAQTANNININDFVKIEKERNSPRIAPQKTSYT
jgi:hypothetical protein